MKIKFGGEEYLATGEMEERDLLASLCLDEESQRVATYAHINKVRGRLKTLEKLDKLFHK